MKIVRRLRVIEYVGSEDWVNKMIADRQVKGTRAMKDGSIREAMLGDTNETLIESEIEQIEAERKQALENKLLEQELPNSHIEIELTAMGRVGSGKGTILTFIAEALKQKGCSVTPTGENSIRVKKLI